MKKVSNRDLLDRYLSNGRGIGKESTNSSHDAGIVSQEDDCYAVLRNIPSQMRSKDLRRYFSDYTENEKFACFHFRHRPELQCTSSAPSTSTSEAKKSKSETCCCVMKFSSKDDRSKFLKDFDGKWWTNKDGLEIPRRCFVNALKVSQPSDTTDSENVTRSDLAEMIELRPPHLMPQGNVGTPSFWFLEQIRLCRMPSSVIPKLGIQIQRRKKKFGAVNFTYDGGKGNFEDEDDFPDDYFEEDRREESMKEESERVNTIREKSVPVDPTDRIAAEQEGGNNDDGADDDDDQCEEWERHEGLHDDVTEQDRTKAKKYEEEMEVVWEKGGPGLVWYTDKNYWDEREKGTDCDWAWADDWDVDYSVYYEGKSAGTADARDLVEIREDEARRSGKLVESAFTKKSTTAVQSSSGRWRKRRHSGSDVVDIEQYTKKVGSRILGSMGWTPGIGLGRSNQGRVQPVATQVEEDGQAGYERKGFGYRGERMLRVLEKKPERHTIASVFDSVNDKGTSEHRALEGPSGELLLRRSEQTKMKYR